LLLFVQKEGSEFLKSYKKKLKDRMTSQTHQNDPKVTDSEMRKIECAIMTLLLRHNPEGQLSCVDKYHLEVADIDDKGFVTVVKCTRCNELMETACHHVKWTYEKIYYPSLLKKGDHICWHRPYAIWHHAIVTKVVRKDIDIDIDIIHYSSSKTVVKGTMSSSGCLCNSLYRVNYQDCYNSEYTVLRAEKMLNEERYNLIDRNCEHFSRWCKTGSANSSQVSMAWTSLGKIVLSMFLKAIGLLVVLGIIEYSSELREEVYIGNQNQLNKDKHITEFDRVKLGEAIKRENLTKLEDVHVKLLGVYIVVMTIVFVVYLVKRSASHLIKVPIEYDEDRRDVPADNGQGDENQLQPNEAAYDDRCEVPVEEGRGEPRDQPEPDRPKAADESQFACCQRTLANVPTCICTLLSFCRSIIRHLCCSVCKNVKCCPLICYRRQGYLACGLFARIFVRESVAAAGTLAIMLNEAWITERLGIKDFSTFARTSVIIVLALLAHIVGYMIGAFIGRWAESICHVCGRPRKK